ncbi:MAG TPA: hypothetical protein DCF95_12635 [Gammaproteobacteria bacterium]|nr:hypothetical protein [Gammaproteobacteria bacterium]
MTDKIDIDGFSKGNGNRAAVQQYFPSDRHQQPHASNEQTGASEKRQIDIEERLQQGLEVNKEIEGDQKTYRHKVF